MTITLETGMPADQRASRSTAPRTTPAWVRRLVAPLALAVAVAAVVIGVRLATHHAAHHATPTTTLHQAAPAPISSQLEAAWGIRFTNVVMLADSGLIELRYQVVVPAKAGRIHQGSATTNQLPTIVNDSTGAKIVPSDVQMHFHHAETNVDAGRTFSIIYGNAAGAVSNGDFVTIVMKDGIKLKHIQVTD